MAIDSASESKLSHVHPELAARVRKLVESLGRDVRVVQGLRTYAEQDKLYAQGRTKPGGKVTNARGGFSNHNFGLAVDLCPFNNGKPDWTDNAGFDAIGRAARAVGLEWGGDWKKLVDKPHCQLPGLTIATCRILYQSGGLAAVWKKASEVIGKGSTPVDPLPSTPAPASVRDLKIGDEGEDVKRLQTALKLTADGDFGRATRAAVIAFQSNAGLRADGIVGAKTRAELDL